MFNSIRTVFTFVAFVTLVAVIYSSATTPQPSDSEWTGPEFFLGGFLQTPPDAKPTAEAPSIIGSGLTDKSSGILSGEDSQDTLEDTKWYFQEDTAFRNPEPKPNVTRLKQFMPHNYKGPGRETFATYLSTRGASMQDPYFQAAQQLAYRLLWDSRSKSQHYPFTVFVAPHIPHEQRDLLTAAGALVRELDLVSGHPTLPGYSRWLDLFSKLNMWNETGFSRIAFLDVDAFPIQNIDGIFEIAQQQRCRPGLLSEEDKPYADEMCDYYFAATKAGFDDSVNVGVIVFNPNDFLHQYLMRESVKTENFDNSMAEQAFLNYAFRPDGPFPLAHIGREWNGYFPREHEVGFLKVIHEKLWAFGGNKDDPLAFAGSYFADTWDSMLTLYEGADFENLRKADGLL